MNSLYTLATRQTSSLHSDLELLRNGDTSASLLGQISASMAAMHRTIDDYDSMAKREIIKAKQERAQMRVAKFRTDYAELRTQFESLKEEAAAQKAAASRSDLLGHASSPSASDSRRRPQQQQHSESPFQNAYQQNPLYSQDQHSQYQQQRTFSALDEHTSLHNTETKLDDFLLQGREILDNLVDQRNVLKGTQRRLLDAANTLGLSRDVINWVERRSTQDMWIFFGGAVFTFMCFFAIWYYLG